MTSETEFRDITMNAMERCRRQVVIALQLLDDDSSRAAVFLSVAMDMLRGAALVLEDETRMSKDEATVSVIASVIKALDEKMVSRALHRVTGSH